MYSFILNYRTQIGLIGVILFLLFVIYGMDLRLKRYEANIIKLKAQVEAKDNLINSLNNGIEECKSQQSYLENNISQLKKNFNLYKNNCKIWLSKKDKTIKELTNIINYEPKSKIKEKEYKCKTIEVYKVEKEDKIGKILQFEVK